MTEENRQPDSGIRDNSASLRYRSFNHDSIQTNTDEISPEYPSDKSIFVRNNDDQHSLYQNNLNN